MVSILLWLLLVGAQLAIGQITGVWDDPVIQQWRSRAPIPAARGGLESGSVDNRIQVLGGEGNNGAPEGVFALNEEYDPASDTWRALAPRPTPRQRLYGMIGAARAAVPYSGLAPSRAGLYQVNARIP